MNLQNKHKLVIFFIFFLVITIFLVDIIISSDSAYGPKIEKENYIISRSKVERTIYIRDVIPDTIEVLNKANRKIEVSFSASEDISDIVDFESSGIIAEPNNLTRVNFIIIGKEIGNYSGFISLKGGLNEEIPVNITILEVNKNPPLILSVESLKTRFTLNKPIGFKLNVNKLKADPIKNASFIYYLIDSNNKTYLLGIERRDIMTSFQLIREFDLPNGLLEGLYIIQSNLEYEDKTISAKANFLLGRSFMNILVLGFIPMWFLILVFCLILTMIFVYYLIRRSIQRKQKYQMKLDVKTIPKKDPNFLFLGKIAEKKILSYLDPYRLTTHCIVAGATGGGKSIAAQVIVEECLLHNLAVIVMDPTAQWSGMLRKCTDKKMMSYYPIFGLKGSDAKAFKGNVRQIKNSREIVDISKYLTPGQINIFSLNKLDPKDIDFFVANFIRQIFKSDPKESPVLKILLVFDEVHRLLSKFGGSGEGFLQVERACREFRKWGIGVMLISQVLSDFVGEIKANISTEIQMRTRDEGDLNRIKTKYGEDFLRSLVKASVGVGMFVNPAYNHAQPYFINFRPILHNTRRLSDEELEKYNNYNEIVDDLEYQIEQLETEKVDTFDLKMELKLIKDKIMTGSFSVVDIYLEGLTPRISKEWEKLGKKPKKRELKLVSEEEVKKSVEEAKKAREKYELEEAKKKAQLQPQQVVEVKEDLGSKEVNPLTFDNGIMVSSLKELKNYIPTMDLDIFKTHVNEKKNDIADWISKYISEEYGEKLRVVLTKSEMIKTLNEFGKEKPKEDKKTEEKKEETKTEGKKEEKPKEVTKKEEKKEEPKEDEKTEESENKDNSQNKQNKPT